MQRRFFTLDVFTNRRLAGNPLAVVLDSQALDASAMQAIAREFNLSETVFVLPPANNAHRAAVRIFTPMRELPFAGHPTVGTAVLLAWLDGGGEPREIIIEETVGPVPCRVTASDRRGQASFRLPKLPEEAGSAPPAEVLASALGIGVDEIGFGDFRPARWSAGNPFIFVPLRRLEAVVRARPDQAHVGSDLDTGVFVFTTETAERGHQFHARMFAPQFGIAEDPATGSAVAAFAGMLARSGGVGDGDHRIVVEQGYEMGRASLIALGMTIRDGELMAATIGGDAVMVSEGLIEA